MKKTLFLSLFISFKMLGQSVTISPTDQSSLKVTNPKGSAKISITGIGAGGLFDYNNITGNATLDLSSSPLGSGGKSTINFGKYRIYEYYDPYYSESGFIIKNVNNTIFSHSENEQKIYTIPLEINGTSATTLKLRNNTPLAANIKNQIDFVIGGTYGIQGSIGVTGVTDNTARMGFFTGYGTPTERLSIDVLGNVGIGNVTPQLNSDERVEINGRLRIRNSTSTAGVWFNNSANGIGIDNGAFYGLETAVSGSERAGIWIGSAWRFYINRVGNANFTGTVTATGFPIASDFRYKKNIQQLENTLSKVQKIVGVSYDLRKDEFPDKNFSDKPQIGFIAQDLEKIFPEMVFTDEKGYKSVDYARLTPVLVEALKELILKNQTLETNNQTLASRLDKIEAMLISNQANTENLKSIK